MTNSLIKSSSVLAFLFILLVLAPDATLGQSASGTDSLIIIVNLERIRAQLLMTERSLESGDIESAFAHAFIPHATTFPSLKPQLRAFDEQSAIELESLLTELPIQIRTGGLSNEELRQDIAEIQTVINELFVKLDSQLTERTTVSQTVVFLLRDAVQSYELSNSGTDKIDYENAIGLAGVAESRYQTISDELDERRRIEINTFFAELKSSIEQKADNASVARLASAIERDLAEDLSLGSSGTSNYQNYFATIRDLLDKSVAAVRAGNYELADQYVTSAYLDNYEYLEAPIERRDPELMTAIEIEMREELRDMIKAHDTPSDIEAHVAGILQKLDSAEQLLDSDPDKSIAPSTGTSRGFADIEGLQAGFGTYSGERREIGEAEDLTKAAVRSDIDQIRIKLDETLQLYRQGDVDAALVASRSAYLDSYENIEIPLRPIDPDFTLDMEIKFAELRNLIQSNSPYTQVEGKVIEIRRGLDESERLVSGTGVVAPAIAFSTSFSIIFREGLESALIVGAILTYLEASRNDRFKKHVYYGIVIALAATAITWVIAQFIIEISGASRELIEAIAGVSAVAVLFWVSFWILNKVETKKWIEFVKAKVWKATTTGSVMVFVMLSFFTVYREGFETVLFYQAMLSFAKYMEWYVAAGLVAGLAVIVAVAFGVRKLGRKLPLRVLFGLTMGIGAYMSIAFMGNAVREFQEVGYISTTHLIGTVPRLDINLATMTGIHPTLETIVAQLVLLAVYLAGSLYVLVIQPRRNRAIEAARKSRAELVRKGAAAEAAEKKSMDLE
ncbi:MAG: FTR1 family iron permease [Nitrososphaera sp.]|nr:FTR1 family iron permease [Nitrososphaera sp.]